MSREMHWASSSVSVHVELWSPSERLSSLQADSPLVLPTDFKPASLKFGAPESFWRSKLVHKSRFMCPDGNAVKTEHQGPTTRCICMLHLSPLGLDRKRADNNVGHKRLLPLLSMTHLTHFSHPSCASHCPYPVSRLFPVWMSESINSGAAIKTGSRIGAERASVGVCRDRTPTTTL